MHFMKNLARVKKFPLSPPSGSNTPLSAAGHLLGFTLPADIQRKIVYFFFSGIREPRKKGGQLPQVAHRWRGKAAEEGSISSNLVQLGPATVENGVERAALPRSPKPAGMLHPAPPYLRGDPRR